VRRLVLKREDIARGYLFMDNDTSARIRERAHELFLKRGSATHGDAFSDWLRAEEEIHYE